MVPQDNGKWDLTKLYADNASNYNQTIKETNQVHERCELRDGQCSIQLQVTANTKVSYITCSIHTAKVLLTTYAKVDG